MGCQGLVCCLVCDTVLCAKCAVLTVLRTVVLSGGAFAVLVITLTGCCACHDALQAVFFKRPTEA